MKYTAEEKIAIVEKVLKCKIGINEASREMGAHRGDIQKWVAAFKQHGITGIERQRVIHTGEFKIRMFFANQWVIRAKNAEKKKMQLKLKMLCRQSSVSLNSKRCKKLCMTESKQEKNRVIYAAG